MPACHQQNVPYVPLGVCSNSFPSKGGCRQDVGVKHLERQRRRPIPGVRPPSPLLALSSLHRMAQGWGDDGTLRISLTTTGVVSTQPGTLQTQRWSPAIVPWWALHQCGLLTCPFSFGNTSSNFGVLLIWAVSLSRDPPYLSPCPECSSFVLCCC